MLQTLLTVLASVCFLTLRVNDNEAFPPVLSKKEEMECFEKMKRGDGAARDTLIRHNLRLVAHIIKKYYPSCREQEDLISIGTIGLIKAIDSYDPYNGTKFATYAGKCLQNEILMYFRGQKKLSGETSIHDALEFDKDGNPLTYMDVVYVEDDVVDTLDKKANIRLALEGIRTLLSLRERQILTLRYGLSGRPAITQREVASKLGISRSYVSRLEKSALDKLKRHLKKHGCTSDGYTQA